MMTKSRRPLSVSAKGKALLYADDTGIFSLGSAKGTICEDNDSHHSLWTQVIGGGSLLGLFL